MQRKGAAAVEFAIVAPLFIVLTMGMIEFGRYIQVQQIVTNAAREGARVASLGNSQTGSAEQCVENYLDAAGITSFDVDPVPVDYTTVVSGDPISITVKVPYNEVGYITRMLAGRNVTSTTVMRKEQ